MSKKIYSQHAIDVESEAEESDNENPYDVVDMYSIQSCNVVENNKILIKVQIDNELCEMEFDTGAAVSTISFNTFKKLRLKGPIIKTETRLKTYTGELIHPIGVCTVNVKYNNKSVTCSLYILKQNVSSILGRDIIKQLGLDIRSLHQITKEMPEADYRIEIEKLLEQFADIFSETVGEIRDYKCSFKLKDKNVNPIFLRPRPVPYALKQQVENEIDRLERYNIIEKTDYCPWGTPVVPVIKSNGQLRLCADYKATINKVISDDKYPIPRVEDIFAKIGTGKRFCTLDLHQAYLHMRVDDESAQMQAISTHKGTYKVNRLMFGVKIAPNTWQRYMDCILHDLPGVSCFFDDIVVQGKNYNNLLENLKAVLNRLRQKNLHLNKKKCQFFKKSITYLGHEIDQNGIRPIKDKVNAIIASRPPSNISELRTFLGLVNYYQRFLPNLAHKLKPLHHLLEKNVTFKWTSQCESIFKKLKSEIASAKTLIQYNPELPLNLATDASQHGIGAVISHVTSDGIERPIAFASRSLTKSERNYSQIDKEATAIIWGMKKFFQYCYGRKFTLITDHKPLVSILHPNKSLPATSATRLLHYANFMSGFNYEIKYRNTLEHSNADYLSRFPVQSGIHEDTCEDMFQIQQLTVLPVTSDKIRKETLKDIECRKYYFALQNGGPLPNGDKPTDFSLYNGCILKGVRVVIPESLQKYILDELHVAHIGVVKMKALARSYVWWRGIDADIEALARQCISCARVKPDPPKAPVHPWEYPHQPWQRIHVDYAGPFMEYYFLIVVDAHTKWVEAVPTKDTSTKKTILLLREIFARFGLPTMLVSDNGTQFRSYEFENFLKLNGIIHRYSAPYHPATNGQAERFVRIIKQGLRAMMDEKGDLHTKLCRLLMQYRKVPSSATGLSPAELMFKRNIRTRIDLVATNNKPLGKQRCEVTRTKDYRFNVGDTVLVRFYNNKDIKWKCGYVIAAIGKLHYQVSVDNEIHTRHVDQLRATASTFENYNDNFETDMNDNRCETNFDKTNDNDATSDETINPSPVQSGTDKNKTNYGEESPSHYQQSSQPNQDNILLQETPVRSTEVRRSTRVRKAPDRLTYESFKRGEVLRPNAQ